MQGNNRGNHLIQRGYNGSIIYMYIYILYHLNMTCYKVVPEWAKSRSWWCGYTRTCQWEMLKKLTNYRTLGILFSDKPIKRVFSVVWGGKIDEELTGWTGVPSRLALNPGVTVKHWSLAIVSAQIYLSGYVWLDPTLSRMVLVWCIPLSTTPMWSDEFAGALCNPRRSPRCSAMKKLSTAGAYYMVYDMTTKGTNGKYQQWTSPTSTSSLTA